MSATPSLLIVRLIPWGTGWRYLIAQGAGHPLLIRSAYRDTCDTFPDAPVLVAAEYPSFCELVAATRYPGGLRPVVRGWEPMALCQACGSPAPDDEPLCGDCSRIIDRATDALLEERHYDVGPDD